MLTRRILGFIAAVMCLLLAGADKAAHAGILSFGDSAINWPGVTSTPVSDINGIPIFPDTPLHSITIEAGKIKSVTIAYLNSGYDQSLWNVLKPGDLFFNLNEDGSNDWDIVVRTPFYAANNYLAGGNVLDDAAAAGSTYDWNVYSLGSGVSYTAGSPTYQRGQETTRADGSPWGGLVTRVGHPWALTPDALALFGTPIGSEGVAFSGWLFPPGTSMRTSTWDFTSLPGGGIDIGSAHEINIGFTVNCSNEVLYGFAHMPEPGTLTAWGVLTTLSAGAFGWRRKKA